MIIVLEQQSIEIRLIEHAFEHLYWQAAGKDHATGKKSFLILEFERKYKAEFLRQMEEYNTINIWQKFKQLPEKDQKNPELSKSHASL